jgi:hypothetical protein
MRYFQDLHEQYIQRQKQIQDEVAKKKQEQIELVRRNKKDEEIKKYMLERMRKKYADILEYNRYVLLFNDEFNMWKNSRKVNNNLRYELFSIMFDYEHIELAYSDYSTNKANYHQIKNNIHNISEIQDNQSVNMSLYDKFDNLIIEEPINTSPVIDNPIQLLIKNHITKDILNPIIDNIFKENENIVALPRKSIKPEQKNINSEIFETINQIQAILLERDQKEDIQIEIPISILIEELYYDIIIKQYKIVNTTFVYMLKYKYRISIIFDFLKQVFLSSSCDITNNLIESFIDFNSKLIITYRLVVNIE